MPNIFEMGDRPGERTGDLRDHDELDYMATEARARSLDPRQRYVPSLQVQSTDALIEIGPTRKG
ncbi:hypothetical protein [Paramagnetospirillum marisnigri]|nr:hypothetical protein [Paramagnetospirillum marisnigri]